TPPHPAAAAGPRNPPPYVRPLAGGPRAPPGAPRAPPAHALGLGLGGLLSLVQTELTRKAAVGRPVPGPYNRLCLVA
ncbi:hypothetical protein ACFV2H_43025, partial [Streptomyces sp. NPDC059629]